MATVRDELSAAPLGHPTGHPDSYDPTLLFAVPRAAQRAAIGIGDALPFTGADRWTAFELTWLDASGKPAVAIATFDVPATSPAIVESKSVKLYLGSFAQSRFDDADAVRASIERDLSAAAGTNVRVQLVLPAQFQALALHELPGESIDALPVAIDRYEVDATLLRSSGPLCSEILRTDLFRSVCPVTDQPDYASVSVSYTGPALDRAGLLRYLVSYRKHAGFHEHCVERIFVDVMAACACESLTIHARFTRRGGIDINPFRTTGRAALPPDIRTPRQ